GDDTAVLEYRRDELIRAFVFLPCSYVIAKLYLLECSSLLERRRDPTGFSFCGKHQREHSLTQSPLCAGEVLKTGAASQKDRPNSGVAHVTPRGVLSLEVFRASDWLRLTGHRSARCVLRIGKRLHVQRHSQRRHRRELHEVSSINRHSRSLLMAGS